MEDKPIEKQTDSLDDEFLKGVVNEAVSEAISNAGTKLHAAHSTYVVPDYDDKCENCKSSPTVVVKRGQQEHRTHLCGVCCWGEAACAYPENW